MEFKKEVVPRVVAYLISAAIIAFASYSWGTIQGDRDAQAQYRQRHEAAAVTYVQHLDRVIRDAGRTSGGDETLAKARAIVSTRDDLRRSLTSLAALLNSEIDRLAQEVSDAELRRTRGEGWKDTDLRQTIEVLASKWPAKKDQIQVEVRKLQREMGQAIER